MLAGSLEQRHSGSGARALRGLTAIAAGGFGGREGELASARVSRRQGGLAARARARAAGLGGLS
jgi:hypothetical protein